MSEGVLSDAGVTDEQPVMLRDGTTPEITEQSIDDGSLAARLRAKHAQLRSRSRKFNVPPYDVWGEDLVIDVVPLKLKAGMTNLAFLERSTRAVLIRNERTGQLEELDGGWATVGRLMGLGERLSIGQIIKEVCSTDEVVLGLVTDIVEWVVGRNREDEQVLGE